MPILRTLAAACLAALTVTASLVASPAADASTGNTVLFGAYVPTSSGRNHAQTYDDFENTLGRAVGIDRTYSLWDDAQPTSALLDDQAHGRLPLLSIKPQLHDGTKLSWAGIAAGQHDADISRQADALKDFGARVLLAFHHEADIASGFGTPADFVAAFRHYVNVFRSVGANNVKFVAIFVPITFASTVADAWYPGDNYVDWIGTDAYNWNNCKSGTSGWRTLAQAAGAFYSWGSARNKPLVLAEWGTAEDPNQPGRKAWWIDDAVNTMSQWPALRAASYFDNYGNCDWRLTTSSTALREFTNSSHLAIANGGPSAALFNGPSTAPAPLAASFDASTSTGTGYPTGSGIASYTFDPGDGSATVHLSDQPGTLTHQYTTPGVFTARLTVVDRTGATATTSAVVHAAAPPTVAEGTPVLTATTAKLPAWVDPDGLSGSYRFEWGRSTSLDTTTAAQSLPAVDYSTAVSALLSGLAPNTRYYWRAVASTAAGTTRGPTRYFTTPS